MSITDELRDYASTRLSPNKVMLLTIADRIDAEHEKAVDIAFTNGRTEGIADGCAYYDTEHTECMLSEEHGWVRGPLDANGEYIHIWDRMEHIELGYVLEAIAIGVDCFIAWNTHLNRYWQYDSKLFRHHHEPTVEDVLREFGEKYCDMVAGSDKERELFAEYAAKLQLKESE